MLKIEEDAAALPPSESGQLDSNVAMQTEEDNADDETVSEDDKPEADLAVKKGVVNEGDINESADVPVSVASKVEVESKPQTYHDRLRGKRAVIGALVSDTVAVKSNGDEIVWEVIANHTVPETKKEVSDARKKQMKN